MCNQMVTSEIREQFHVRFVQILIISRTFIVWIENSSLSNVQTLNLAYKVQNFSHFFGKILVRILLDVLFCVFRFSKASFCALTSSFTAF